MKNVIISLLFTVPFVASATTTDELVQIHALTTAQRAALSTPIVEGTLVFDASVKKLYVYADAQWQELIFIPKVYEKTGDYTLTQGDNGAILTFNSASAVTITIPTGLPIGYNISVYQIGTGKVTIASDGTTSIKNRLSRFRTAGKDAGVGIVSTATDVYHLTGDLRR